MSVIFYERSCILEHTSSKKLMKKWISVWLFQLYSVNSNSSLFLLVLYWTGNLHDFINCLKRRIAWEIREVIALHSGSNLHNIDPLQFFSKELSFFTEWELVVSRETRQNLS